MRLDRFEDVRILIDDARCFDPQLKEYADYPSRSNLVQWAERNGLFWTIESDIFIACKGHPKL